MIHVAIYLSLLLTDNSCCSTISTIAPCRTPLYILYTGDFNTAGDTHLGGACLGALNRDIAPMSSLATLPATYVNLPRNLLSLIQETYYLSFSVLTCVVIRSCISIVSHKTPSSFQHRHSLSSSSLVDAGIHAFPTNWNPFEWLCSVLTPHPLALMISESTYEVKGIVFYMA